MKRNYKKGVYTLREIGETVYKKCPGRFKNEESAYAMAKTTAQRLGIGDINGKKRCKFITATDAKTIVETIQRTPSKKAKRAEQVSLFDRDVNWLGWLDDYTPDRETSEIEPLPAPVPDGLTPEQVEAIADFMAAWKRLCEVYPTEED